MRIFASLHRRLLNDESCKQEDTHRTKVHTHGEWFFRASGRAPNSESEHKQAFKAKGATAREPRSRDPSLARALPRRGAGQTQKISHQISSQFCGECITLHRHLASL